MRPQHAGRRRRGWKRRVGAVFAILCLGAADPARAAEPFFSHEMPRFRTGADLLADCAADDPLALGRCAGYVMAIADVLGGASARIDGVEACLDGEESLEELVAAVLRHLKQNPGRQAIKGDGAVAYALSLYRPCGES